MDNNLTAGGRKSWKVCLGFALLLCSVLVSFAQNMETGKASRIVVTRENLHSFSSGADCKSVPYTGLQDGKLFMVAEAFVRMELWTPEGLGMPLEERRRLIDSQLYFLQGNAYANWSPTAEPEGVCPQLYELLATFHLELEGMLSLVRNSPVQLDPPCEPAIALMVNGNRVVESYELVTDCGLR